MCFLRRLPLSSTRQDFQRSQTPSLSLPARRRKELVECRKTGDGEVTAGAVKRAVSLVVLGAMASSITPRGQGHRPCGFLFGGLDLSSVGGKIVGGIPPLTKHVACFFWTWVRPKKLGGALDKSLTGGPLLWERCGNA